MIALEWLDNRDSGNVFGEVVGEGLPEGALAARICSTGEASHEGQAGRVYLEEGGERLCGWVGGEP